MKYYKKDLENFEYTDEGKMICPSGDYSEIDFFPMACEFANRCIFGPYTIFSDYSSFGNNCIFAEGCTFCWGSRFGSRCSFVNSTFYNQSSFGEECVFTNCNLDRNHSFSDNCFFKNTKLYNKEIKNFIKIAMFDLSVLYIYNLDGKIYVANKYIFESLADFKKLCEKESNIGKYKKYLKILENIEEFIL